MSYEAATWYNEGKDSDGNIVADAPKLDADNFQRMDNGIERANSRIDKIYSENLIRACDYSRLIKNTTYSNKEEDWSTTWTVTEDCWISFTATGGHDSSNIIWKLYIDNSFTYEIRAAYGYNSTNHTSIPPCLFVKQGSILKFENIYGTSTSITVKAYACLE